MNLLTSIEQISPISKSALKRLKGINIKTAADLLYHFPFRYEDWSKIITISQLKSLGSGTIKAKIVLIQNKRSQWKKKLLTEALLSDKTDSIKAIWFNQPYLTKVLKTGTEVYLAGKIESDEKWGLQIINPSYEIVHFQPPIHLGRLVPIYRTVTGLSQKQIRNLIRKILPLAEKTKEWLPEEIKNELRLFDLPLALEQIHFPGSKSWLEKSIYRLKFNELFLLQLKNQLVRLNLKQKKAPSIKFFQKETKKFVESLPFKLTNSQKKTSWQIIKDLEKSLPMNRLLEGDVGSGKTIVAAIAILNVVLNNYQVVYLAPTEILSEQHFKTLSNLYKKFPIKIGLLTRTEKKVKSQKSKVKSINKNSLLEKISKREIDLIIGTHALLQENIKFTNLGIAIVDEQHRFGVEQRAILSQQTTNNKQQTISPHFLSMTATPIPRSLALTLYGDLDLSIIDEMPAGRKKVLTKIVKENELKQTYQFIREEIKKGRQAFIICPLIDPSDILGVRSVKEEYKKDLEIFPDLKIGLLHGRIKSKEKEDLMKNFLENKINLLVSTTVIEVGIDVPNASIMIIRGAERFGLAQLYQLKGRIGRSVYQSYCFLFPENPSQKTFERLNALIYAKNGFELAEIDLKMRGPGEIFGTEQSGYLKDLNLAQLSDTKIIEQAQIQVKKFLAKNPDLKKYPLLKEKIGPIGSTIHLE